jgi:N-acetylglucosaminyldiphosphoundecaprenol N-acetyl-beta-D-mannosaminyltransferase
MLFHILRADIPDYKDFLRTAHSFVHRAIAIIPGAFSAIIVPAQSKADELPPPPYNEARGIDMMSQDNEPVKVWGLPLVPDTFEQALDRIDRLIAAGRPSFFITANLNYAMLCDADERLQRLNECAAFILADGMPLVWWSRLGPRALPERVAGSDLIYGMCERAAAKGHRVFLLGAGPGIADAAAENLVKRFPGLKIVGVECPPFRRLTIDEEGEQFERIRAARPDILFVAFGQPKGEFWIVDNLDRLGVPVCVQVGASLDFVAGRVKRSPRWMQRTGLEWVYRLAQEPRRLAGRYLSNIRFLLKAIFAAKFRRERTNREEQPRITRMARIN